MNPVNILSDFLFIFLLEKTAYENFTEKRQQIILH
jgi:hypothetical protein